ncbi:MAG TPA: hypothetical protein DCM86_01895 [Verrucomicrobiales bacterium]|nr:hypothetical protein [Verrucomicrobiales bacterium]
MIRRLPVVHGFVNLHFPHPTILGVTPPRPHPSRLLPRAHRAWGLLLAALAGLAPGADASPPQSPGVRSLLEFGVTVTNSPEANREALQRAIDWASPRGGEIFVDPTDEPYPMAAGLLLRQNVSLVGVHGPVGRGTRHPTKPQPVGSVFRIDDSKAPFLTVEGATQVRGLQFWYPSQTLDDPARILPYPPTIQVSKQRSAQGVTLSCLTFYGEFIAMDFNAAPAHPCEQILFEHCYGYPLGGEFIRVDYCYDIPRLLHCHVNPSNQRYFRGGFSKGVVDKVVSAGTFAYAINHTDNAVLMDLFTFGTHGGVYLGPATYGQLTSFNLDCVRVGIWKLGDGKFNRNWQIAQGSIIANAGTSVDEIHPLVIEGEGHTAISNVEAFSGGNPALTTVGRSHDFLLVRGEKRPTVVLTGCRMRNYSASDPLSIENPRALVRAIGCLDREERAFEFSRPPVEK